MPKIEGFKSLQSELQKRAKESKRKDNTSVTVGYTQNYAIWVHEVKREHKRPPTAQWKYLSRPAREQEANLAQVAATTYVATHSMEKALLVAGRRLQRESEPFVPRDTSALAASAFVALTKNEDEAAAKAYVKSEFVKARELDKRNQKK